jgi:3-deoxy-manno-octulosonate cytidylyltransferase (CMP-KDO synthetase)
MNDFHIIIPARYHSSRLPGKLLMDLNGMSVIERVYHQAQKSHAATVTIATDHKAIYRAAVAFGANVIMTSPLHETGTDRLAEAVEQLNLSEESIIVNVQGDEPLIAPALIQQVAHSLTKTTAPMATLCWPIENEAMFVSPNVVKVVRDNQDHALYFSRSSIPANRNDIGSTQHVFRHIGLYAYRAAFLCEIVKSPVCVLEEIEALEQLRVLWAGYKIKVEEACVRPLQDINTLEDLVSAQALLANEYS